jgi:hypothetical protein
MPSQTHAVLVDLFRSAPALAFDLLNATGIAIPGSDLRVLSSTFPVTTPDYHVDFAVGCYDVNDRPSLIVLVEVQLDDDDAKHFSWPLYVAAARARYRCDVCLLVVAIEERVAAWARRPVALGPAGPIFHPTVLGPAAVPHAFEPSTPELAVLSALAHGAEEPDALSRALLSIDAMTDDDRRRAYFDLLRYHLGAALDRALEAIMATSERPYLSDFANDYFAKGKAEGRAEGARIALVAVVTSRGLSLGDEDRARIAACSDAATLEAWVGRAARAAAVAEIFGG